MILFFYRLEFQCEIANAFATCVVIALFNSCEGSSRNHPMLYVVHVLFFCVLLSVIVSVHVHKAFLPSLASFWPGKM